MLAWVLNLDFAASRADANAIDSGAGSGKYRKPPEDWEIRQWLESLFPRKPEPETAEKRSESVPATKPLALVNVDARDLDEYATAIARMGRIVDLYQQYTDVQAEYEQDKRRKQKLREIQRIRVRVATIVQAYIKRQKNDETALIVILAELV